MTSKYDGTVEVVASALIVNNGGEVLLIQSHKWGDKYLIPGGHIEHEETLAAAAKREGEEETSLELKVKRCVNVGELINSPEFYRKAHLVYFHFVCAALTQDVALDDDELKEFIWVAPEEALPLVGEDRIMKQTIQNYIDGVSIKL